MARELIEDGYYNGVAVRTTGEDGERVARWGFAGKNRTKQVLIYFKITTPGEYAGMVVPWFGYFSKDSARRTVESLRYCGFKGESLLELDRQPLDQEVQLQVETDSYENEKGETKTRSRIAWVNSLGAGSIKLKDPMGEAELRTFDAMMRESIRKVPEVKGEPPKAVAPSNGSGSSAAAPSNGGGGFPATAPSSSAEPLDEIPFASSLDHLDLMIR